MFDNDPVSYWYSGGGDNRNVFAADFGAATAIAEARMTTTGEGSNYGRIPAVGKWIASNDGKTFWEVAALNSMGWVPGETRSFALGAGGDPAPAGRRRQSLVL